MFLRLFLLYDVGDRHNILNFVKKIHIKFPIAKSGGWMYN